MLSKAARESAQQPTVPAQMAPGKSALYIAGSAFLFLTQGLGMNLASANLAQVQGSLSATSVEAGWLAAAYGSECQPFGRSREDPRPVWPAPLRRARHRRLRHRFIDERLRLGPALGNRRPLHQRNCGAPLSSLGFLYMLEAFPPQRKLTVGLALPLTCTTLAAPITRLISPQLIEIGQWHGLYTLEMALP